jgi:hypothetical protein
MIPHKLIRMTHSSDERDSSPTPYATPHTDSRGRNINRSVRQKRRRSRSYSSDSSDKGANSDPHHNGQHTPTPGTSSRKPSNGRLSTHKKASRDAPSKRMKRHFVGSSPDCIRIASSHSLAYQPESSEEMESEGSPSPDAPPEEVDEAIWKALQGKITDEHWVEFMKIKAIPPPLRVSEVLKQYRFVKQKLNEWEDREAPFKSSHHIVTKVNPPAFMFSVIGFSQPCVLAVSRSEGTEHGHGMGIGLH